MVELCCYRMAERGIISEEGARVLVTLYRRGPLNGVELAEYASLEASSAIQIAGQLAKKGVLEENLSKYSIRNPLEKLAIIMDNDSKKELEIALAEQTI